MKVFLQKCDISGYRFPGAELLDQRIEMFLGSWYRMTNCFPEILFHFMLWLAVQETAHLIPVSLFWIFALKKKIKFQSERCLISVHFSLHFLIAIIVNLFDRTVDLHNSSLVNDLSILFAIFLLKLWFFCYVFAWSLYITFVANIFPVVFAFKLCDFFDVQRL